MKACCYLLDGSVTEHMPTPTDSHKWVASAVEMRDRADKTLRCLSICSCGQASCLCVLQVCEMHSENVSARRQSKALSKNSAINHAQRHQYLLE